MSDRPSFPNVNQEFPTPQMGGSNRNTYSNSPIPASQHHPQQPNHLPPVNMQQYYHHRSHLPAGHLPHDQTLSASLYPLPFTGGHAIMQNQPGALPTLASTPGYPQYHCSPHRSSTPNYDGRHQFPSSSNMYPPQRSRTPVSFPSDMSPHRRDSSLVIPPSPHSAQTPLQNERYPCPHCDKTFTRNFDRKRHMEIHSPGSGGMNKCQYCHKDYSRPDSLKRHLDNGCDMKHP